MADYQTFFNISHDLFCVLDHKGYYKNVNPAFFNLLQYPEEELTRHPFFYFVHPEDVAATLQEYEKAGRAGGIMLFKIVFAAVMVLFTGSPGQP